MHPTVPKPSNTRTGVTPEHRQAEREAYAEAKDRATRTAVKLATEVGRACGQRWPEPTAP